eukprot:4437706-Alexandrium_andersonii.AAC.1
MCIRDSPRAASCRGNPPLGGVQGEVRGPLAVHWGCQHGSGGCARQRACGPMRAGERGGSSGA